MGQKAVKLSEESFRRETTERMDKMNDILQDFIDLVSDDTNIEPRYFNDQLEELRWDRK